MTARHLILASALLVSVAISAQTPAAVDTSRIGPQVGSTVPPIAGVDQFGRAQTLASVSGRNGVMLVFFRSADW